MALSNEMASAALGLGSDLVDIERIKQAHKRHGKRFLRRVYTQKEQDYCLGRQNPYPHLAVRFAAKEAISKCFGTGIGPELDWTSVSIGKGSQDEPYAILDPKGQKLLQKIGGSRVLVSLSHTRLLAQAVAFVVKKTEPIPQAPNSC